MHRFVHTTAPARIVFGAGRIASVGDEVDHLGRSRALVLGGTHVVPQTDAVLAALGDRVVARFDGARQHTPVEVTEQVLPLLAGHDVDVVVAVGGGSTIGLAKALALRTGVDQVAVPTTFAGSEVTPVLGETQDGVKRTTRDAGIAPETVIYDVEATATMPIPMALVSAVNALAHAVEALYSPDRTPITDAIALESVAAIGRGIPELGGDRLDLAGRDDLLLAAWLAGTCLASAGMGLHHKLCHTLGGTFELPHAQTHTVVLPHVMAYNAEAVPEVMERIADALGVVDAPSGVYDLVAAAGGPLSLDELGMPADRLDEAAALATRETYPNPREVTTDGVRRVLAAAYDGTRPDPA